MRIRAYQQESKFKIKSTIIEDIKHHFGLKVHRIFTKYRLTRLIEELRKDFKLCKTRIGDCIPRRAVDSIVRNSRKLKQKVAKVKVNFSNSIRYQPTKIMTKNILNKSRMNLS